MKYQAIVGIYILVCASLASCKPEGKEIGDLYGRWRLRSISHDAGVISEPDTVYLSFMSNVYQYQPNWDYDWGTFERTSDSITLNPLAYQSSFGFRDLMHNDAYNGLQPVSFRIENLSRHDMVLQRGDTLWHFRKFID